MKVGPCSSFVQAYFTLSSWYDSLTQKIRAIWQRIWADSPSFRYAFSQQSNADCHLQMWVNFNRLQELRAKNPSRKLVLETADFKTHRQWLGSTFLHFQKWLAARNGPRMRGYITGALKQAPCAPELFKSTGKRYLDESWNPIERGERSVFSPVFLEKVRHEDLSYTLPMYEEKGTYFCYNQETSQYEQVQLQSLEDGLSPTNLILSEGQRASLPPHFNSLKLIKLPGKTQFIQALDQGLAIGKRFIPRHLGTYKLLLLNFGFDAYHHAMNTEHPDSGAMLELQTAMRQMNTPWSLENCKK